MRCISVFSGIEAASVAWRPLGWEPVAFCEVDKFPSAVLAERFPNVPNLGDITKVNWKEVLDRYGPVDIVVGGSPCQSFSVAGKREGLRGESGLMFEYIRCVREVRPRAGFLWENVPGALSSEGGRAFGQLLAEMEECGYGDLAWRVLDAQFFGVAQRRRRVFLVGVPGDAGGGKACEILFEPESLRWDHPSSREKRQELAARSGRGAARSHTFVDRCGCEGGGKGVLMQEDVASTLATAFPQTVVHEGCMTPWDCQSKRVFDPETATSPSLQAGSGGGTQCPTVCYSVDGDIARGAFMGKNGKGWNDEGVSSTLTTLDTPAVCFQQNTRDEVRLLNGDGELAGALAANPGAKQQNYICLASGQANAEVGEDVCTTQSARQYKDPPIVCMADDNVKAAIDEDICGSLKKRGGIPMIASASPTRPARERER